MATKKKTKISGAEVVTSDAVPHFEPVALSQDAVDRAAEQISADVLAAEKRSTKPCHCCGNPVTPGAFCPVDGNITL